MEAPAIARGSFAAITPKYIRLPAPGGRCPWTGLSRTALAELCVASPKNRNRPPVRSIAPRKKGAKRAARLIDFGSLMTYLDSQDAA
jgi:hypothetical protein